MVNLPASAKEARALGVTRYFTGKPCKRGHVSPRRTSCGGCIECTDEAVKAYRKTERGRSWMREWSKTPTARTIQARRRAKPEERAYQAFWKRTQEAGPAAPSWLTDADRAAMLSLYLDAATRDVAHHVDHIIPLNHPLVCGLHVPANLQVLAGPDNVRKGNSFEGGWQ